MKGGNWRLLTSRRPWGGGAGGAWGGGRGRAGGLGVGPPQEELWRAWPRLTDGPTAHCERRPTGRSAHRRQDKGGARRPQRLRIAGGVTCGRCSRRTQTREDGHGAGHYGEDATRADGAAAVREPRGGSVRAGYAPLDRCLQVSRATAPAQDPLRLRARPEIWAQEILRPSPDSGTRTACLQPESSLIRRPRAQKS